MMDSPNYHFIEQPQTIRKALTFHGQLEEKATLEDEQAQASQAHESEPS
tara:strand:+ start:892 stop:1038 length:147 start_codon:yes stop_codon:yes gene_type:complete